MYMNRQHIPFLIFFLALTIGLGGLVMYQRQQFTRDHYRIGSVPESVLKELLPESIPLAAMRPPALRPWDPIRFGSASSVISVIEYGDFQCEYCRQMDPVIQQLIASYGGRVRLVWRDFPIEDQHPQAFDAALFARCASLQGKYWPVHDALIAASSLREGSLSDIALTLQLDPKQMAACRSDKGMRDLLVQDIQESQADGVHSVPFIFVGTKAFEGVTDTEVLRQAIDAAL